MTDPEKESEKQQGFSKEAWTAISAIAVALISDIVTIFVAIWNKPSPSPSPSTPPESPTTSSPSVSDSVPTVSLPPSPSAQRLAQDLDAVNIDIFWRHCGTKTLRKHAHQIL